VLGLMVGVCNFLITDRIVCALALVAQIVLPRVLLAVKAAGIQTFLKQPSRLPRFGW
jgi:hypothetical protein